MSWDSTSHFPNQDLRWIFNKEGAVQGFVLRCPSQLNSALSFANMEQVPGGLDPALCGQPGSPVGPRP